MNLAELKRNYYQIHIAILLLGTKKVRKTLLRRNGT